MKIATAIVTGAAGWLGRRLVEALASGVPDTPSLAGFAGAEEIRCLALPSDDVGPLNSIPRTRIFCGDVTRPGDLQTCFSRGSGAVVFHCAGIIHPVRSTSEWRRVNVKGTFNVVETAIATGCGRLVHLSSNSPFGFNRTPESTFDESSPVNPYMGYGRSKAEAESIVSSAGASGRIETVIVRAPWFYGPCQPERQTLFFRMVRAGKFPIVGSGDNRRSMAYLDNLCQGLLLAAMTPSASGNPYWIADRRPYPMNEIVATVESVLHDDFGLAISRRQLRLPSFAGSVARLTDGAIQRIGRYSQKVHVLSEMDGTIACSIGRAERELGYDPRIELREGMRRSVKWALDHGAAI